MVGSDSGRLSILELVRYGGGGNGKDSGSGSSFYRLRCAAWMPLGPGGCRRSVPGQYVAADPKGRAVFTGTCVRVHETGKRSACPRPNTLFPAPLFL